MDLHALTIHELHDLLDTREVSARDVTEAFYRRIEALDDRVHAYLTLTRERRPIRLTAGGSWVNVARCWVFP